MKAKKRTAALARPFLLTRLNWIWTALAAGLWIREQFVHVSLGTPLSWLIFSKGLVLLAEASLLYGFSGFRGFYFLGMFPLSWLAVSRFQWDLCARPESHFWAWLALFLGAEILILCLPDGKKLLWPLVPLWAGLIWLFKFSFLLPLTFLTANEKRLQNASWARWGGLASGLGLFAAFKGWAYFQFQWMDFEVIFVHELFFSFFLLGWLGLSAFDAGRRGIFRHVMFPLFLLPAGFLFLGGGPFISVFEWEALQWVLVWMAGYGLEAFRVYMMDPTWHGRAVWFAMGAAFFGGVF